jgi:hypothetical protein
MPADDLDDATDLVREWFLLALAAIVAVPVAGLLAWRWLRRRRVR